MVKNISPETLVIDLGKFNLLDIRRHTMSKTFSIKTTKSQNDQCTDGFKVSSSFYTEKTLVEEDKALLIGNGLKLRILDENASPYTFNKYAEYADFTSDMLIYEKPIRLNYRPHLALPSRRVPSIQWYFLRLTITDLTRRPFQPERATYSDYC